MEGHPTQVDIATLPDLAHLYPGLPSPYAKKLSKALFGESTEAGAILQTRFETTAYPLSKVLSSVFNTVAHGQRQIQFVHPGCGSKGADEAWAAYVAGQREPEENSFAIRSFGIDPKLTESRVQQITDQQIAELHEKGLIDGMDPQFIAAEAEDESLQTLLNPDIPFVVLLRHPEHSEGRGDAEEGFRGFDYTNVFERWIQIICDFSQRGINAIFIVSDPTITGNNDHQITFKNMQKVVDGLPKKNLAIAQISNPFAKPRPKNVFNDGLLTMIATPTLLASVSAALH